MNVNQLKDSKFLKKEDCGKGIIVTIRDLEQINVAKQGAPEELKWCLNFQEELNPMVLNNTNAQLIASITGEQETDQWVGHKIVLYNDPTILYAGKLTGGIRVRAARNAPAKPAQTKQSEVSDSEVPF